MIIYRPAMISLFGRDETRGGKRGGRAEEKEAEVRGRGTGGRRENRSWQTGTQSESFSELVSELVLANIT